MGQPSRMRTTCWRARATMRAGVCHKAQRSALGSAAASRPGEAEQLEPSDQVGGEADDGHPCPVGGQVSEGKPLLAGLRSVLPGAAGV